MSRALVYGRVKATVIMAHEKGLTVREAAAASGLKARSIRSVSDQMGLKLKPARASARASAR